MCFELQISLLRLDTYFLIEEGILLLKIRQRSKNLGERFTIRSHEQKFVCPLDRGENAVKCKTGLVWGLLGCWSYDHSSKQS